MGEDELECSACTTEEYQCHDFGCVDKSQLCNGVRDCTDGSDELNCGK